MDEARHRGPTPTISPAKSVPIDIGNVYFRYPRAWAAGDVLVVRVQRGGADPDQDVRVAGFWFRSVP
jgi:hypothetical protein